MSAVPLKCCQGQAAPEGIVHGWNLVLELSEAAREDLWQLLAVALLQPESSDQKELLEAFGKKHKTAQENVFATVQSCSFLLGSAAVLNMDGASFEADLEALSGGKHGAITAMIAHFEPAKADIRRVLIQGTLADHGKLVTGFDWRVDKISASNRGIQLDTNVIFLTLRYIDGDQPGRTTVQLTPESIQELRAFTERFQQET